MSTTMPRAGRPLAVATLGGALGSGAGLAATARWGR